MSQCEFRKQDEQQCKAHAMQGATLCFSHNPKVRKNKKAAVTKGGRNRRVTKRADKPHVPVIVKGLCDIQQLLFKTLEDLQNGKVDVTLAKALGYIAGITTKIIETHDLEERLAQIELNCIEISERASHQP